MLKYAITGGLFLSLLFTVVEGHAAKRILKFEDHAFPEQLGDEVRSLESARRAIISGCTARGWQVKDHADGVMVASIWVRAKHYAEVEILFTPETYSIRYLDSENLDYNARKGRIHRQYNNWVINLSRSIDRAYFEEN